MKIDTSNPRFRSILAGICVLAGLFFPLSCPFRPSAAVWQGYRILTVPLEIPESSVLEMLAAGGIAEPVTESNSVIRNGNPEAPIQPFLAGVNESRRAWFESPAQNLRFMYLPDRPFLERSIGKSFAGRDVSWFLEDTGSYALVPPILAAVFALCVLLFVRRRVVFLAAALPIVLLPVSCNRFPSYAASVSFLAFLALLAEPLRDARLTLTRNQKLRLFRANRAAFVPLVAAFAIACLDGLLPALLFLAAALAALGAAYLAGRALEGFERVRDKKRLHPAFRPQAMHPAGLRGAIRRPFQASVASAAVLLAAAGFFAFRFTSSPAPKDPAGELYIPAPARYTAGTGFTVTGYSELAALRTESSLPDLGDFLSARWNVSVFPYLRVQDPIRPPEAGSTAGLTGYALDGNGVITGTPRTLYTFDTGFIRKVLSSDTTPLEKMLTKQGRFVTVDMTRLNK